MVDIKWSGRVETWVISRQCWSSGRTMPEDVFHIVGSIIAGTYQVEQVVAEGGFAVVYRAHHAGFSAPVAMKCLKVPQRLSAERQSAFLMQFRAEAELLFQLSASIPNVVRPLHVDAVTTTEGAFVPYMVLEWLEGETLEEIVERRIEEGRQPLTIKRLVRMLTPIARALERAHNFRGPSGPVSIVHRDLKPDNIFIAHVAGEEVPKILDFGIGKAKSVASQVAGRESQADGGVSSFTPAYGAPEQWLPKRFGQTGPWTDVWGLALTMVEVMAARPIIDGDQSAMMGTTLDSHRRPSPRTEGVDVSDDVEAVFQRALALDPRDRQPDAGAFWDELLEALGEKIQRPRDLRQERGGGPREERLQLASSLPPPVATMSVHKPTPVVFGEEAELSLDTSADPFPLPVLEPPPELEPPPALELRRAPAPRKERSGAAELEFDVNDMAPLDVAFDLKQSEPPPAPAQASAPTSSPNAAPSGPRVTAQSPSTPRSSSQAIPALSQPSPSAPSPVPRVTAPSARSVDPKRSAQVPAAPHSGPVPPSLARRLAPGIGCMVGGIALTLADKYHQDMTGVPLPVVVPAQWIAGPLILLGVVLITFRLLPLDT
jgi:eukaryotic-like serine/threonine-protein kinase